MIAHEDILAMDRTIIMPPPLRLLDGLSFRMIIGSERNSMFL
jgi:hypothetical protein